MLQYLISLFTSKNTSLYRKVKEYQFDEILMIQINTYYLEKKSGVFDWQRASRDFYDEKDLDYYYEKLVEYNETVKKTITYLK